MTNLDDLTVLNDLRERLAQITPEQIAAAARRLNPPKKGETVIGTIEAETTRAVYTLWTTLLAQEKIAEAQAGGAASEEMEAAHNHEAALFDMLGDAAREIFWAQAKIDLGVYDMGDCHCVGLRENWQLVKTKHGGGIAGLGELILRAGGDPPPV